MTTQFVDVDQLVFNFLQDSLQKALQTELAAELQTELQNFLQNLTKENAQQQREAIMQKIPPSILAQATSLFALNIMLRKY